jgi:hypothetical protein
MKCVSGAVCGLAILLLTSSPALASGWVLRPATADQALQLSFNAGQTPAYLFACGEADIRVTEFGVTELLDIQTGHKIADEPGSVMAPGASVMALFTGKGDPDFMPAESVPNAVKGWDLTIRFSKTDKRIRALGKSNMLSLFTTGYTMAVDMDSESQALARSFLKQCGVV